MTKHRSKLGLAALLAAPLFALKAVAAPIAPGVPDVALDVTDPSLIVFDQKADGGSINLSYVFLPHNGYVALYGSDADGKVTGDVLGYVPLPSGDHRNVTVKIDKAPESGTTLWASLYRDVDGDKKLDKEQDKPFWPNGKPLENSFNIL